jgi:hypothetical protein
MNRKQLHTCTYLFFLLASQAITAQRILGFNLFADKNSVTIKFTIAPGPSCNGFSVLHSADSITYNVIYNDVGICGNQTDREDKTYRHEVPLLSQVNYYRVRLEPYVEISEAKSIYLAEALNKNISVYPNPVYTGIDMLNIRVKNTYNTFLSGYLYDQQGYPLRFLDFRTIGDFFNLPIDELNNGLYIIWLTDGKLSYSSKFVVSR